ncbi:DUF6332 family protein [Streptomyces sp. MA15]|uniref:DUF6332 family protein n=1 Tax=unclassified Streptomyces TaxID=2593676 RepID=UPI0025AF1395|nr:DUF6332 family protein [Streptomyces sp. MA15]MDN3270304.1 DUF6332 family protein [Streptomyces sp. MA15]
MRDNGGRTAGGGGRRGQAERDAITVEIGYALCSAAFAAAVVFGAMAGPALLFALPGTAESVLVRGGAVVAGALFAVRTVSVLVRFRQTVRTGRTGS